MVVVNGNVLTAWAAATGPPQFLDPLDLVGAGEVARAAGTMEKSGGGTATERLTQDPDNQHLLGRYSAFEPSMGSPNSAMVHGRGDGGHMFPSRNKFQL
jgi:hypothetical protein